MTTETPVFLAPTIPSACPVCGAYSLAPEAHVSTLLAVCDVLVLKALEKLAGHMRRAKGVARAENRDFIIRRDGIPLREVYMRWLATDELVDQALDKAWEVVPLLLTTHGGCCDFDPTRVTEELDQYVHDLVVSQTPHDIDTLSLRLQAKLGLPVYRTEVAE